MKRYLLSFLHPVEPPGYIRKTNADSKNVAMRKAFSMASIKNLPLPFHGINIKVVSV